MEIFTEFNEKERGFSLFFYFGFRTSSQGLVDSAQDLIFRNSLIKLANIPIIENPFNTLPKFESLILGYAQRLFAQKNGRKIIHTAGFSKNFFTIAISYPLSSGTLLLHFPKDIQLFRFYSIPQHCTTAFYSYNQHCLHQNRDCGYI